MVLTREETAAIPTLIDSRKFLIGPKKVGLLPHVHISNHIPQHDLSASRLKSAIKR